MSTNNNNENNENIRGISMSVSIKSKLSNEWQVLHGKVISSFLEYLNSHSKDFVLKGGTALMMCYELDRFSEDIDLDGRRHANIHRVVEGFCDANDFSFRVAKDTDTVKRFMINYGNEGRPLKVEVSYRKKEIEPSETAKINGILVYSIETLCLMKVAAYAGRDKIRDLYDLAFMYNNHLDKISPQALTVMRNALEFKGIENFDFVIRDQHDELIDNSKLAEDFLEMFDGLGLLYDESEGELVRQLRESATPLSVEESATAATPSAIVPSATTLSNQASCDQERISVKEQIAQHNKEKTEVGGQNKNTSKTKSQSYGEAR